MGEVERRIDTALRRAVRQRNYRRVRDRALTRLSVENKERYLELLDEERARDEQEEKAWLDITGRTGNNVGAPTANRVSGETTKGLSYSSEEGELG